MTATLPSAGLRRAVVAALAVTLCACVGASPPSGGGACSGDGCGAPETVADSTGSAFTACISSKCAAAVAACQGVCAAWWACHGTCDPLDNACQTACVAKLAGDSGAVAQSAAVVQCLATNAQACMPADAGSDLGAGSDLDAGGAAACKTKADCPGGQCLVATGKCVQCTAASHCAVGSNCIAFSCVAKQPCVSDKQCAAVGGVCASGTFDPTCVDCNSSAACPAGSMCVGHVCAPAGPKCASSKDCAPYGLVCAGGSCVECTYSSDCPAGFVCSAGATCVAAPPVCKAAQTKCADDHTVATCSADGKLWLLSPCADNKICTIAGGAATCVKTCCAIKGAACGVVSGCSEGCGSCPSGAKCIANQCVALPAKLGLGGACNVSPVCPPPKAGQGDPTAWAAHLACLNGLCSSGTCYLGLVCGLNYCQLFKDEVTNSGAPGSDGIEDPGGTKHCMAEVDGPFGVLFRCVKGYDVPPHCVPGYKLADCASDADCPANEACAVVEVNGFDRLLCTPRMKHADGSPGLAGMVAYDPFDVAGNGAKVCANTMCHPQIGCIKPCKSDSDCAGAKLNVPCQGGTCGGVATASPCKAGSTCSGPWTCKVGTHNGLEFPMCLP